MAVEVALQPFHREGIQVVGGLVHQQHIWIGQQHGSNGDALAVATRKLADAGLEVINAKLTEDNLGVGLQFPRTHCLNPLRYLGKLRHQGFGIFGFSLQAMGNVFVLAHQGHLLAAVGKDLL